MNMKWESISSIIQIIIGFMAIVSFIVLIINGKVENLVDMLGALLLSIGFVVLGIIGIIDYKSQK